MQSTAAEESPDKIAQGLARAVFRGDVIGHKYLAPDEANSKPRHQKKPKTGQKPSEIYYDIMMAKYNNDITVGEFNNGEECCNKTSVEHCRDIIIHQLKHYYMNPTTSVGGAKDKLTAHRKFQRVVFQNNKFAEGFKGFTWNERTNYIYCGDCLVNEADPHRFRYVVIAVIVTQNIFKHADGNVSAAIKVTKLYPHCCECTTPTAERQYWKIDGSTGGRRFNLIDFPQTEIVRDTFDRVVSKLSQTSKDSDHPGTKIENITKSTAQRYEFDRRYYLQLLQPTVDQVDFFCLDGKFDSDLQFCLKRLQLWLANYYDCVSQFYGSSLVCPSNESTLTPEDETAMQNNHEKHLYVHIPAMLYGGHHDETDENKEKVDQTFHYDIGDTETEEGPKSVSENQALLRKVKPASGIISLDPVAPRKVNVCEHSKKVIPIEISFNKLFFMWWCSV